MQELRLNYDEWKAFIGALPVFYIALNGGYRIWAVGSSFSIAADISSAGDVADFEATYKPTASAAGSMDDAFLMGLRAHGVSFVHKARENADGYALTEIASPLDEYGSLAVSIRRAVALDARLDGYSIGPLPVMVVSPNRLGTSIDGYSIGPLPVRTGQLPSTLVDDRLDGNMGAWMGSTAPTVGQKTMAASIPVALASDQSAIPVTVAGGSPMNLVSAYLLNGSAYNMKVNGSLGSPQIFKYDADPTKDILLHELRFVFSVASFDWSGTGFGKAAAAALTNGILTELVVNNGTTVSLTTIKINEDFLRTFGESPTFGQSVATDVLVASFRFSGGTLLLKAGTADQVRVSIRDNLTIGSLGVNYLSATFFGYKVI